MSESKELATRDLTEEALVASATGDLFSDADDFVIPRLKVGQSLTSEVVEKEAEVGDLIHSLTGYVYGTSVELIVVRAFKGRSWRNPKDNSYRATNGPELIVPWEDHPCYGQPFVECPDAEEQFRAAVRRNERDWGKGPGIATTFNFVALLFGPDGELENFPVRISLERAAAKEGRNWSTMLNIARAPWDDVYELSTTQARSKAGQPYTAVRVKRSRSTEDEERRVAVEWAQRLHDANVAYEQESDDMEVAPPAPEPATGGLDV